MYYLKLSCLMKRQIRNMPLACKGTANILLHNSDLLPCLVAVITFKFRVRDTAVSKISSTIPIITNRR